jgi:excisionase family DNA binding protein
VTTDISAFEDAILSSILRRDRRDLLTPGEVAVLFRVNPKTVTRWALAGRIPSIRTPGGHRRFRVGDIIDLVSGSSGV